MLSCSIAESNSPLGSLTRVTLFPWLRLTVASPGGLQTEVALPIRGAKVDLGLGVAESVPFVLTYLNGFIPNFAVELGKLPRFNSKVPFKFIDYYLSSLKRLVFVNSLS